MEFIKKQIDSMRGDCELLNHHTKNITNKNIENSNTKSDSRNQKRLAMSFTKNIENNQNILLTEKNNLQNGNNFFEIVNKFNNFENRATEKSKIENEKIIEENVQNSKNYSVNITNFLTNNLKNNKILVKDEIKYIDPKDFKSYYCDNDIFIKIQNLPEKDLNDDKLSNKINLNYNKNFNVNNFIFFIFQYIFNIIFF